MAMEKQYVIRDTHTRVITALGYHPVRREIFMGCEDGVIKMWEGESGKLVQQSNEHRGWVTDFLYWSDTKLMLSSSNDGYILAWGSGGGVYDKIEISSPVYCMALNQKRHQLLCGMYGCIKVFDLDDDRECGHVINPKATDSDVDFQRDEEYTKDSKRTTKNKDKKRDEKRRQQARHHTDIVRCLVCHESRVYSAGYDRRFCIFDSAFTGEKSIQIYKVNHNAHDAGISCLLLIKDNENQTWIVTGSFDKTVKLWSSEGKFQQILPGSFLGTISGLSYVPKNKTIWVAGGTSYASLFDSKSGDNVSDFIGTFQEQEEEKYTLQILKYFPESNQVASSTSRRHLIVWKYNTSGCVTALKSYKVPILIFSGDNDGVMVKWERMQSNHFMYSKEALFLSDAKSKKKKKRFTSESETNEEAKEDHKDESGDKAVLEQNMNNKPIVPTKVIQSHYAFNKPFEKQMPGHKNQNTIIMKTIFIEDLDVLVAACEDGHIYVWGFDSKAVDVLKTMEPTDPQPLIEKYAILLNPDSKLLPKNKKKPSDEEDAASVTNRVAGFICKHILSGHFSCVTSLLAIGKAEGFQKNYVLSGGWDSRLCIWDVEEGKLHDTFRNTSEKYLSTDQAELACDGIIIDMAYNPKSTEFAYASSDKMVYIRRFSLRGNEMTLVNTLQGHEGEITCVRWNDIMEKWVTGSEDGTIRIWAGSKMNECEQTLAAQGSILSMCIDRDNGAIVAGVQDAIRVYDPDEYRIVQSNLGHTDAVRTIVHIPERSQYVSGSWDKTIRVWNAWRKPKKKQLSRKEGKKNDTYSTFRNEIEANTKALELGGEDSEVSSNVSEQP